jgi:uncharacterized Fe-S cluster-containing radical SAM superfamily enzyme
MSERITEPSLYPFIIQLFKEVAELYGIRVTGIEQVGTSRIYPDISLQLDGLSYLSKSRLVGFLGS